MAFRFVAMPRCTQNNPQLEKLKDDFRSDFYTTDKYDKIIGIDMCNTGDIRVCQMYATASLPQGSAENRCL